MSGQGPGDIPQHVWLALPGCEKMHHRPTVETEAVRDHSPVAPPPERFGAHERGPRFARERDQALVPARELLGFHVIGVTEARRTPTRAVMRNGARVAAASGR